MGLFDGIRQETGRTGASGIWRPSSVGLSYSSSTCQAMHNPPLPWLWVARASILASGCRRILNKVASERHRRLVEDGMARIGMPVLGALMRSSELILPERHLGLVQAGETDELDQRLERLADAIETSVEIERLLA